MAGVAITVHKPEFGLFRYCMAMVTVFYLIFSAARPDVLVAEYNMAQMGQDISFYDLRYLSELSADTVPILSKYEFPHENCRVDGSYNSEYDYYAPVKNWLHQSVDREREDQGCRRCLLHQTLHQILEETSDMNERTFCLSRYLARQAAKSYFYREKII